MDESIIRDEVVAASRKGIRALATLGWTAEEIARKLNQPTEHIESVLTPPTKLSYSARDHEQINCPACEKVVLTPFEMFKGDLTISSKIRHTYCIHCGKSLTLIIPADKNTDITVKLSKVASVWERKTGDGSCHHIGVAMTTEIYIMELAEKMYEARVGVAIMGSINMPAGPGACPFDIYYQDNWCQGFGSMPDAAVKAMMESLHSMADSIHF